VCFITAVDILHVSVMVSIDDCCGWLRDVGMGI